jgi:RimJ/RimL family protein N-acetyltransferase
MHVTVLPISAEHIEEFHRVLDVVACEHKYLTFLEAPPLEDTRAFIVRNMACNNIQLVAFADGRVVGWADILPKDRPVHAHVGVLGIGVLPEFRGKGLGTALLRRVLEQRCTKYVRVELTVRAANTRAIALYEKFGFKPEGICRDAIFVDGRYEDLIMMADVDRSRALAG